MTATLPPPPDVHVAPYPAPPSWPRPPRWLGLGMVSRLARRELRSRPIVTASTVAGGLAIGVVLAGALVGPVGAISRTVAAILLVALAAALTDATSPSQQDDAAVLVRLGCPRSVVRLSAWAATVAALGVPAAAAAILTRAAGLDAEGSGSMWFPPLALTALGAATTCGTRLPARTTAPSASTTFESVWRLGVGGALLLVGGALPAMSQTGSDLDLALPLATIAAIAGLAVLAPVLARAAATGLAWIPWAAARIAASTLRTRSRSLTVPVALVAGVSCILVVQGVVGQALGAREQERVDALAALGPASTGGGERAVVLQQALLPSDASGDLPLDLDEVRKAAGPDAVVGPIDLLSAAVLPPGGTLGTVTRSDGLFGSRQDGAVALATPELLRALGLDESLWEGGDRPLVLDDRLVAENGTVHLVARDVSHPVDRRDTGLHLEAVDAAPGEVWVGAPGVLLPRRVVTEIDLGPGIDGQIVSSPGSVPTGAVVRFAQRPTDAQLERFGSPSQTGVTVRRGDRPVDLREVNRTDRAGSVWVRTTEETRDLALALGALEVAALAVALVALRLAVRPDDAVLVQLGARPRTLTTTSAVRAGGLTAPATLVGGAVGLLATRFGFVVYDGRGRVADEVVLAPLRWSLPTEVLVGLVALPFLGAALGALVGSWRRSPSKGRRTLGRPEASH